MWINSVIDFMVTSMDIRGLQDQAVLKVWGFKILIEVCRIIGLTNCN
jgi:hypothetical protein